MTPKEDAKFLLDYAKDKLSFNKKQAKLFSNLYVVTKLLKLKDQTRIKHWIKVKTEIDTI
jgi:hypothetical protein